MHCICMHADGLGSFGLHIESGHWDHTGQDVRCRIELLYICQLSTTTTSAPRRLSPSLGARCNWTRYRAYIAQEVTLEGGGAMVGATLHVCDGQPSRRPQEVNEWISYPCFSEIWFALGSKQHVWERLERPTPSIFFSLTLQNFLINFF